MALDSRNPRTALKNCKLMKQPGLIYDDPLSPSLHPTHQVSSRSVASDFSFHFIVCRYDIMLQCWQETPEDRPTFKDLHSKLHSILSESAVRIHLRNINSHLFKLRPESCETFPRILAFLNSWIREAQKRVSCGDSDMQMCHSLTQV